MRGYVAVACTLGGVVLIAVAFHALWKHRKDAH